MKPKLSAQDLAELLARNAGVTLVDVRRAEDREADPQALPGAIWRDRAQVADWANDLPRGQPVVAYCMHGRTGSAGVVDRLRELGFDAALLEGGFAGWKAAGGRLVAAEEGVAPGAADADAVVNEASDESFPASDPPSYTPVSGAGRPERD